MHKNVEATTIELQITQLHYKRTVCVCQQGIPPEDFYILRNGRRADLNDPVQNGATYHLQPRLCGGKGGMYLQYYIH